MTDRDADILYEQEGYNLWEKLNDDHLEKCKYCFHYNCPFCCYYDDECPEKEPDDYCEHFELENMAPESDRMEDW